MRQDDACAGSRVSYSPFVESGVPSERAHSVRKRDANVGLWRLTSRGSTLHCTLETTPTEQLSPEGAPTCAQRRRSRASPVELSWQTKRSARSAARATRQ